MEAVTPEPPAEATSADDPADLAALSRYATALADAVDAVLAGWVQACVAGRWTSWTAEPLPVEVQAAAEAAGDRARAEVMPALRALLATDVDAQRTNPLALLRAAVVHATGVLEGAGVAPVTRDASAVALFPHDHFDLTPGSFADVHLSLHEPGVAWGAAKAHVVLRRRRRG
jgi:hypothetical protein